MVKMKSFKILSVLISGLILSSCSNNINMDYSNPFQNNGREMKEYSNGNFSISSDHGTTMMLRFTKTF